MKKIILIQYFFLVSINLCIGQNDKVIKYSAIIHDTINTNFRGGQPDTTKLLLIFRATFDKDLIKIYVNNKLYKKWPIEINYSVSVEELMIPNVKKIHTIGISVNNANIVNIKIKPKIYVIEIDDDKLQNKLQIHFLGKEPFIN